MNIRKLLLEHGLYVSWAIALIATLGSLYFSEVIGYIPCSLCWVQRIFMYPLAVILGIAAVRKDYLQIRYALPLAIIGSGFSIYHNLLQKTDWFSGTVASCGGPVPCDADYIYWLGFITIPMLALTAFVLIIVVQLSAYLAYLRS